jgi:hypothetical protein
MTRAVPSRADSSSLVSEASRTDSNDMPVWFVQSCLGHFTATVLQSVTHDHMPELRHASLSICNSRVAAGQCNSSCCWLCYQHAYSHSSSPLCPAGFAPPTAPAALSTGVSPYGTCHLALCCTGIPSNRGPPVGRGRNRPVPRVTWGRGG